MEDAGIFYFKSLGQLLNDNDDFFKKHFLDVTSTNICDLLSVSE